MPNTDPLGPTHAAPAIPGSPALQPTSSKRMPGRRPARTSIRSLKPSVRRASTAFTWTTDDGRGRRTHGAWAIRGLVLWFSSEG